MEQSDGQAPEEIQALFREVNERVRDVNLRSGRRMRVTDFVCECADPECSERLTLSIPAFDRIRARPRRFVVCPGHERPGPAGAVERHEGFVVVEQRPDESRAPVGARAAA